MERGGKYGEGSRGNLKLWQSQKSGMDSFLYRVDENMTASTYSLNKIPERNLESMSSHSAHSIPLYLMPRPNSVAGESLPLSLPPPSVKVEKETEIRLFTGVQVNVWYFFWLNWIVTSVCHVAPYFWLVPFLAPSSLLSCSLSSPVSFLDEMWFSFLWILGCLFVIPVITNVTMKHY